MIDASAMAEARSWRFLPIILALHLCPAPCNQEREPDRVRERVVRSSRDVAEVEPVEIIPYTRAKRQELAVPVLGVLIEVAQAEGDELWSSVPVLRTRTPDDFSQTASIPPGGHDRFVELIRGPVFISPDKQPACVAGELEGVVLVIQKLVFTPEVTKVLFSTSNTLNMSSFMYPG